MGNWNLLTLHPKRIIKYDLDVIRSQVSEHAQFLLFKRRVKEAYKTVRFRGADRVKLQRIVSQVASDLRALSPLDIADPSTHSIREEQVKILRRGMKELVASQLSPPGKAEEHIAVQKDTETFRLAIQVASKQRSAKDFSLRDMLDPTKPTLTSPRFPPLATCQQVKKYLVSKQLATNPDLWVRHHGEHERTDERLSWSCPRLEDDVQGLFLEFVDLANRRTDYIVVLKYQENRDLPQPIDIARLGDPCCEQSCRNLQHHLQAIWPNHKVIGAVRISDGSDVLSETFDTGLFDPRSNNLCVYLE